MSVQIYIDHPQYGSYSIMGHTMVTLPLQSSLLPLLWDYYHTPDVMDRQVIAYNIVPAIVASIQQDIELLYIQYHDDIYGALIDAVYPGGRIVSVLALHGTR